MTAISIRGIDDKAIARLKQRAVEQDVSLNLLVARVLEAEAGLATPRRARKVFDDLDHLAGTWKQGETAAFEAATAPFREVDESLWK